MISLLVLAILIFVNAFFAAAEIAFISLNDAKIEKIDEYDAILLGFPIWWYVAPTIINTFLESYNFSGKKIALFATSGMSGMGNTTSELKKSSPNAVFIAEKRFASSASQEEIEKWLNDLDI